MNNRIETRLAELKAQNRKALVTYITAGCGGYEQTEEAVLAMEKAGADIIEIGVPFSDPVAEGPIIQEASLKALERNTTLAGTFEMVKRIRKNTDMPLLLMLYVNTVFRYGTERFFSQCKESGIDGVIIPDLPYEEYDEIKEDADKNGIISISLVTPVSFGRIEKIAASARGFLYCVSSTGVTGVREHLDTDFTSFFENVNKYSKIPNILGFGISTPEQVRDLKQYADGIITGSAVVRLIDEENRTESTKKISEFTASLRDALAN